MIIPQANKNSDKDYDKLRCKKRVIKRDYGFRWLYNITSLHTVIVPNTTCRPSKKLSPMMITVLPPLVHPSLGQIAFIHGAAVKKK